VNAKLSDLQIFTLDRLQQRL